MGKFNSSLTRVQPIFKALHALWIAISKEKGRGAGFGNSSLAFSMKIPKDGGLHTPDHLLEL